MPRYNAQCGEDKWIVENLNPNIGVFVEIGAFNGVQSSNTIAFEDLGWGGICVEADPFLAAQCMLNRKCKTICAAVDDVPLTSRLIPFFVNSLDRGLSGLEQPWAMEITVPVVALEDVIDVLGQCDLLSIDTEGTELDVWRSRGPYRPGIVIVEYQTRDLPSKEADIVNEFTKDQYRVVQRTQYNLIFTRD